MEVLWNEWVGEKYELGSFCRNEEKRGNRCWKTAPGGWFLGRNEAKTKGQETEFSSERDSERGVRSQKMRRCEAFAGKKGMR